MEVRPHCLPFLKIDDPPLDVVGDNSFETRDFDVLQTRCRGNPLVHIKRGGTTGVSDEEEMDVGKPTLSGPDCTRCGADQSDSGHVPEATEHGRERERERDRERQRDRESTHATPTQHTSLMYRKQRKETHPTPIETRICTTLYILQEQDTTPALSQTKGG